MFCTEHCLVQLIISKQCKKEYEKEQWPHNLANILIPKNFIRIPMNNYNSLRKFLFLH